MRQYYAYILASKSRNLYNGISNDLLRRMWEHRNGLCTFTSRYKINRLVYYEVFDEAMFAIIREKQIKHMLRAQKIALIERTNPAWDDLANEWFE
ncbi:MAG TPA: GIY-YIG nuclease family protein [Gemmatimonadaceae bacterium]|nr:GIY-YIG nuclease family protein [Gemmatimonadaceae bacterium]